MTRSELEGHSSRLKKFGLLALVGAPLTVLPMALSPEDPHVALFVTGMLLVLPLIFYLVLFTIWHWKERYVGDHSKLWGALLVIETSGLFKLIYFFRHVFPDLRQSGRYTAPQM